MSNAVVWMALALAAVAVELPWGKGETLGEQKTLDETTVCTDGKNHFVVVAPHPDRSRQLFYGDGKVFVQVRLPGGDVSGADFFEPRYPLPTANPNWRGVDIRVHSAVEVSSDGKSCKVRCGDRRTQLEIVEPEKARAMLLAAKYQENPQQFEPHAFLRDDQGNYFMVEHGVRPGQEKNYRVWIGPKGKMTLQKMINVVSDSEGQIFSTQRGELRLIVDRVQDSVWISGKRKVTLRLVPVQDNWTMIYNDLGVYRGVRLGTPCDDL